MIKGVRMNFGGNIAGHIGTDWVQVTRVHPAYGELAKAFIAGDAETFLRVYRENQVDFSNESYENKEELKIEKEKVEYRGRTIDDPVLVDVVKNYSTKCDAIKHFLDNMFLNPMWESIQQLGEFLKHNNFPLTEDGCFLGYKAVGPNWKDIYTNTIDNSLGTTVTMPRMEVTFDPELACSAGLHVGTYEYAKNIYGSRDSIIVVVKVNPAHCVSVCMYCGDEDCDGECEDDDEDETEGIVFCSNCGAFEGDDNCGYVYCVYCGSELERR